MKNTLLKIFFTSISIITLSGCSLLDNNVKEFGNISFVGDQTFYDDTTYFDVDGIRYVGVGSAENNIKKGECIGAKNGLDHYSYKFYTLTDFDNSDILVVYFFSKFNMAESYQIYCNKEAKEIPCDLLFEFPHFDSWFNGGLEQSIFDTTYVCYGSFLDGELSLTSKGIVNEKEYFTVDKYNDWIACKNKYRDDMWDIYYQNKTIKSIPSDIVWAVHTY